MMNQRTSSRNLGRKNRPTFERLESRVLLSTTLLPITDHKDIVIDSTRNELIIVGATGAINRYNITTGQMLAPISLGINTGGSDISPDGQYLYVPSTTASSTLTLDRVNLTTGAIDAFTLPVSPNAALFDAAVLSDGRVELTTVAAGQVQKYYKFDPNTHTIVLEPSLNTSFLNHEPASIFRSADGESALFIEPQNNSVQTNFRDLGGVRLLQLSNGSESQLATSSLTLTSATTAAFNHDGTLYAVDLPAGVTLFSQAGIPLSTITGAHGGLSFSPTGAQLYIADPTDDALRIVDTSTASQPTTLTELPFGADLSSVSHFGNGQIAVSPDGTQLFVTTTTGISVFNQPVHTWNAAVSLTAPASSSTYQSVTLTANVITTDPDAGLTVPTGRVWFYDTFQGSTTLLGSSAIINGTASLSAGSVAIGQHTLSTVYSGDANFSSQSAVTEPLAVSKAAPQISLTVQNQTASTFNPGDALNLLVTITQPGAPPITGPVSISNNSTNQLLGSAILANGSGTLPLTTLPEGAYTFRADFPGNTNLAPVSATVSFSIERAATSLTLQGSSTNSQILSVTISSPYASPLTGTASLMDNGSALLTTAVINRAAQFNLTALPVGSHTFTVTYSGDSDFRPGTSQSLQQSIFIPTSTFLYATSTDPTIGQSDLLTANVTPGVPGTVTFRNGIALLGTVPVSQGKATISFVPNQSQAYTITAHFTPDDPNEQSTFDAVSVTANQPNVLDILALYTTDELAAAGSVSAILTHIQSQIADTNQIFANSLVPATLRLAALLPANYGEQINLSVDLTHLGDPTDGVMDNVPALRASVGADLVVLLDANATPAGPGLDTEGIAYELLPQFYQTPQADQVAYLVIAESAPDNLYVLAHEIGHTLGAAHSTDDPGGEGLYEDAHGYRFTGDDGQLYHDVMSYYPGTPIPYYSNPDVDFEGVPTGVAKIEDAVRVISSTVGSVAAYRTDTLAGGILSANATTISGWVMDSKGLANDTTLRIDIDGVTQSMIHSDDGMPDVLTGYSSHNFTYTLPALATGNHVVKIYALDATSAQPILIATQTVTANHVTASTKPVTLTAGQHIGGALSVAVTDAGNHIATASQATLTLSLASGPVGGVLSGILQATAVNGVATFDNAVLSKAGTYKLNISDGHSKPAIVSVTVAPDATGAHLVMTSATDSSALPAKVLAACTFALEDEFGNVLTTNKSTVTLNLINGPTGGTLSGTTTAALSNGIAKFSNLTLSRAGDYQLAASDAALAVNTPVDFNQTVFPGITTIAAPKPAASYSFGQTLTLSTTLKYSATNAGPFAGLITLTDQDNTILGTATLTAAGAARFTFLTPDPGTYTAQINYPGDATHVPGTSSHFTLLIKAATTTTTLAASPTTLVFGQSLTLTATVKTPTPGAPARTGTINFYDGATLLNSATLNNNLIATFTFTPATVGAHSYKAVYSGDTDFAASTSALLKPTVAKDKTTLTLTPSVPSPIAHGTPTDLTIHVAALAPGAALLTGDHVTIKDGSKILGTLTLDSSGNATLPGLTYSSSGTHSLTALFTGDADTNPVTSSILKLTIT